MDNPKVEPTLNTLIIENVNIKNSILSYLEEILPDAVQQYEEDDLDYSSLINLIKHQQHVQHKLTQINLDLKKFTNSNKLPSISPKKKMRLDQNDMDIETLKSTSCDFLTKFEKTYLKLDDSENSYRNSPIQSISKEIQSDISINEHDKSSDNSLPTIKETNVKIAIPETNKSKKKNGKKKFYDINSFESQSILNGNSSQNSDETISYFGRVISTEIKTSNNKNQFKSQKQNDILNCNSEDTEDYSNQITPKKTKRFAQLRNKDYELLKEEKNLENEVPDLLNIQYESKSDQIDSDQSFPASSCEVNEYYGWPTDSNSETDLLLNKSEPEAAVLKNTDNCQSENFSALKIISNLGVQSRYALNEEKQEVAKIPNLKLRSVTSTDAKKLVKIEKMPKPLSKYVIANRDLPLNSKVTFSHVESPWEFYLKINNIEANLLESLNDYIKDEFVRTKTIYSSKNHCLESIGRFCCAYLKEIKKWCRVEITDCCSGLGSDKLVMCQLVDYGKIKYVHFKHLREITEELCSIPKMAIKCRFPWLYPPGSTKNNLLTKWPSSSVKALKELAELNNDSSLSKPCFRVIYSEKKDDGTIDIDLYHKESGTIGEILINLHQAVEIVLPEDDPDGIYMLEKEQIEIERAEQYLDINEAITGYNQRDEARICKFTRPDGTCYRGNKCKFEHKKYFRGGFTTDEVPVHIKTANDILIPKTGTITKIRLTRIVNPTYFYFNFVEYSNSLYELEETINQKNNINKYQVHKIVPAAGEIVLVFHYTKRWMRGMIRHINYDEEGFASTVQVFMVDYGDIVDVKIQHIRIIWEEFLNVPFQAFECCLFNFKGKNDEDMAELEQFFYKHLIFKEMTAQVMQSIGNMLYFKLFFEDEDVGQKFLSMGYVIDENINYIPKDGSLIIPG